MLKAHLKEMLSRETNIIKLFCLWIKYTFYFRCILLCEFVASHRSSLCSRWLVYRWGIRHYLRVGITQLKSNEAIVLVNLNLNEAIVLVKIKPSETIVLPLKNWIETKAWFVPVDCPQAQMNNWAISCPNLCAQ